MPRVTVSEVLAILPSGHILTEPQISAIIPSASCIVDRIEEGFDLNTACLKNVELYLSVHFCAATDNSLSISSEKEPHLNTSITYGFKFSEGLMGTSFGQMANLLSGGALLELDKQPSDILSIGSH